MKTIVSIRIAAHHLPGGARVLLEATQCGSDVARIETSTLFDIAEEIVWLELGESDARVARVLSLLAEHGEEALVSRYDLFTPEELQTAPLLRMVDNANEFVSAGPKYGTKYDTSNACPTCGTGIKRASALYVSGEHRARIRKHRAIGTWGAGPLLDGGIEKNLRDCGISGVAFGEVYARLKSKKDDLVARQELIATHTLPPVSHNCMLNRAGECPTCHRGGVNGFSGQPFRLLYRRRDLIDIQDVNLTWEWFGPFDYNGDLKKSRFSTPAILVTPKVMNIFREAGVTTFDWIPIFVED